MSPRLVFRNLLKHNRNRDHLRKVLASYHDSIGGPQADLMLDDLCLRFGVFSSTPAKTAEDALRREGARRVVVFLLNVAERHGDISTLIDEATQ